jgi:FG-GAP-like repeat
VRLRAPLLVSIGVLLAVFAGLLVSGAAATGATGAGPSFAAGPPLPLGPTPSAAAVGDFDGDGSPDLAIANANYYRSDVRVLLNDGAGHFRVAPGSPFKAGDEPSSVVAADFDGDGKLDLAVASDKVRILLGDGTGRFHAGSTVQLAGDSVALLAADLSSDGRPDLVALTYGETGYAIAILLNGGAAGFTTLPGPAIEGKPDSPWIALTDFTGDGKQDLALSRSDSASLSLFPGDSAGGFGSAILVAAGKSPGQLGAADFNGDGKQDLAVSVKAGLAILLGDGTGGFRKAPGSPLRGAAYAYALAIADLDGDGQPDLAFADPDYRTGAAVVELGNGEGGFRPAPFSPFYAGWPGALVAADLNRDRKTDLLPLDNGIVWGPAPRGNMVLSQPPSEPAVAPGRSLPAKAVFSTRKPISNLAADGGRAAFCLSSYETRPLRVWTAPGRRSASFGADCEGMNDLAIAGGRVAWIEYYFGNTDRGYVVSVASISGGRTREVDSTIGEDIETVDMDDVSGPWVGALFGGDSVLAYNAWQVGCVPPPCDEECESEGGTGAGCYGENPTLRVSGQWLGRIGARRALGVRRGLRAYPLRAVGGGRMAVEPAGEVVVLRPNGSRVSSVPAQKDDSPRGVALSRTHLALLRTFTLELYSPATGVRQRSIQLGPAAGLELAGVSGQLALLRGKGHLVLVRLRDGKLVSFPLGAAASAGFVDAKLTGVGLFYVYNLPRGAKRGRVVFEPTARLLARFRGRA